MFFIVAGMSSTKEQGRERECWYTTTAQAHETKTSRSAQKKHRHTRGADTYMNKDK